MNAPSPTVGGRAAAYPEGGFTPAGGRVGAFAQAVLTAAVRGRRDRGGPWGEAVLAEFGQTTGGWAAARWAAGGVRVALRERRAQRRRLPRWLRISRNLVTVALIGLLAAAGIDRWLLGVHVIPSGNMEPTLQVYDRWLLDRVSFRATGLRHGDVLVTRSEADGVSFTAARRVIGLPGDAISCRDGRVWRNDAVLDEPYLPAEPAGGRTDCRPVTVPDGAVYLLGDHRADSWDSRHDGPYRTDAVDGRLLFRLWPAVR